MFQRAIITHGGAGSSPRDSDGPQSAAEIGMKMFGTGGSALGAVACVEDTQNPGRMNLFDFHTYKVLFDYGHNPESGDLLVIQPDELEPIMSQIVDRQTQMLISL